MIWQPCFQNDVATVVTRAMDQKIPENDWNIDGSCPVFRINCSLVTPVSRQMQSDVYQ